MVWPRRISALLIRHVLVLIFLCQGLGLSEKTSEEEIKAAYLYNFAKFVEWPENSFETRISPIVLCVIGENTFGDALGSIENKKIMGRSLIVKYIKKTDQAKTCHILFISDSEKNNLQDILAGIGNKPCLTVGSMKNFARQGGMVGFVRVGNNIRFEVNLETVNRSNLTISSRLLKIALIVSGSHL